MTLHLVTGGTGYLGRHLVGKLLAAGKQVRVLARSSSDTSGLDGAEVVTGDVTKRGDLEAALEGVGRVFHLAAETRDGQPADLYDRTNHRALTDLLELAAERKIERLVYTSHYYAIGRSGEPRSAPDFVNDENWTHDPGDMHDAHEESKNNAENALSQRVSLGEPVLALIPTMMFGPEARPVTGPGELSKGNRIVAMLSDHARGRFGPLSGDGKQLWNLVHVEDVAAAHMAVMDADDASGKWPPPAWIQWHYFCAGENIRAGDLFAQFGKAAGVAPPPCKPLKKPGLLGKLFGGGEVDPRAAIDAHSWAFSPEIAAGDWGYTHRPFAEALAETVEWMGKSGLLK